MEVLEEGRAGLGTETRRVNDAWPISGVESTVPDTEGPVEDTVKVGLREREKTESAFRLSASLSPAEDKSRDPWPHFPLCALRMPRSSIPPSSPRPRLDAELAEVCLLALSALSLTNWMLFSRASRSSARARFSSASSVTRFPIISSCAENLEAMSWSWLRRLRTRVSVSSASSLSTSVSDRSSKNCLVRDWYANWNFVRRARDVCCRFL